MNTDTTILEEDGDAAADEAGVLHVLVMSPDAFVSVPLPPSGTVAIGRSGRCPVRLDDPLASREHARFHVGATKIPSAGGGVVLHIEDLQSANGTRVRDQLIPPGQLIPFLPGEAITVGSTVVMVQQSRPAVGLRRLWSHAYFESRLEDECMRVSNTEAGLALARVQVSSGTPWISVVPVLVKVIPLPHLFAAYGPRDYEVLFVDLPASEVTRLVEALMNELTAAGIEARQGIAWHPRDGRSADALLAHANSLLKQPRGQTLNSPAEGVVEAAAQGGSPNGAGMERIRELAKRTAAANINVLILGETGVGKDVLAGTVHKLSKRKGTFVAFNCASLSPSLIESELFGHEKGAFSGAGAARVGLLEAANGGTVFLDEIGEMPLSLQSRLLRAIDNREVLPVGSTKPRAIDVRFLAATNRELEAEVARGTFRDDLFFRLNTMTLKIPPLRERTDEIPGLVATFIAEICAESGRQPVPVLTAAALKQMLSYPWPGNIRELKNVVERALVLADGNEITPAHLPEKMRASSRVHGPLELTPDSAGMVLVGSGAMMPIPPAVADAAPAPSAAWKGDQAIDLERLPRIDDPLKLAERTRIIEALAAHAWNQTRAAEFLGMPRRTFVSKLEYYGIPRPQKHGAPRDAQ